MRVRPRVGFAAPLVIVLGCRRPIAEPLDEPMVPRDASSVRVDASIEIDAAVVVPADAAVAVAVEEPRPPIVCGQHGVTCNPPHLTPAYCDAHPDNRSCPKPSIGYCREHPTSPRCPCAPPTICNPPGFIVGRIVSISVVSDGTQVEIGVGSDHGVTNDMTARVLDAATLPELTLVKVSLRSSRWVIHATPDQIRATGGRVRIAPK